jgi:hypothetical protein
MQIAQTAHHGIHHVHSTIALREYPIAALCLERYTDIFEERHDRGVVKRTDDTIQKATIARNVLDNVRWVIRACDIAASFSRDHHLAPGARHLLEE